MRKVHWLMVVIVLLTAGLFWQVVAQAEGQGQGGDTNAQLTKRIAAVEQKLNDQRKITDQIKDKETHLEKRVAKIEHKLKNVEKLAGFKLDNDAAVAKAIAPRRVRPSHAAKLSSAVSQLQTVRSQMELYQVQHNGNYPDLSQGWSQMTNQTDASGRVVSSGGFGPYLQSPPVNPFTGSAKVVTEKNAGAKAGWIYDRKSGKIKLIAPKSVLDSNSMNATDVVTY